MTLRDKLIELKACPEAVAWVGERDLPTAWAECQRGDWMLWLISQYAGQPGWPGYREIVLCACDMAERTLRYVPPGLDRPRLAIVAARRCAENPTPENKATAWEAGATAWEAWAAWAAWATAWAAKAAGAAAWAAGAAGEAAELKAQADLCRKWLTPGPIPGEGGVR